MSVFRDKAAFVRVDVILNALIRIFHSSIYCSFFLPNICSSRRGWSALQIDERSRYTPCMALNASIVVLMRFICSIARRSMRSRLMWGKKKLLQFMLFRLAQWFLFLAISLYSSVKNCKLQLFYWFAPRGKRMKKEWDQFKIF